MDPYFNVEEAAQQLHRHPVTVRRLLAAGRLPGRKVGRAWLVSGRALAELLDGPPDFSAPELIEVEPLIEDQMTDADVRSFFRQ